MSVDHSNISYNKKRKSRRFGIGEWYGRLFTALTPTERRLMATSPRRDTQTCPFDPEGGTCNKKGGVCSIRLYEQLPSGAVSVAGENLGRLRTVCPKRFDEDNIIYRWVSEVILSSDTYVLAGEIGFLERLSESKGSGRDDVGRIDKVLAVPSSNPLDWCALEAQAVYFSGSSMGGEFRAIAEADLSGIPFPVAMRRPDYRSSGPKRLMPQLQIKVPTLRRWGKKMAVVVDIDFWEALGTMDCVSDVSNCDIAWFIVDYSEDKATAKLTRGLVQLTTLERAVEGLTAGGPVSLGEFESRIRNKLRLNINP